MRVFISLKCACVSFLREKSEFCFKRDRKKRVLDYVYLLQKTGENIVAQALRSRYLRLRARSLSEVSRCDKCLKLCHALSFF